MFKSEPASVAECAVPEMEKKKKKKKTELGPFLFFDRGGEASRREWTRYCNPVVLVPRRRSQK